MSQFESTLNSGIRYTKKLLAKRDDDESLLEKIIESDDSPLEIFDHALSTLIHFSKINFSNFETDKISPLVFDNSPSVTNQLLKYCDRAQNEFSSSLRRMEPHLIEKHQDFIGTTIMHTLTHIGQAIRLQKNYLENEELIHHHFSQSLIK